LYNEDDEADADEQIQAYVSTLLPHFSWCWFL
jgi:hypothetical protein